MIENKIQQQLADGSVWTGRAGIHPHDGPKYARLPAGADRAAFVEALRQRLLADGIGVVAFPASKAVRISYGSVAEDDLDPLAARLAAHLR